MPYKSKYSYPKNRKLIKKSSNAYGSFKLNPKRRRSSIRRSTAIGSYMSAYKKYRSPAAIQKRPAITISEIFPMANSLFDASSVVQMSQHKGDLSRQTMEQADWKDSNNISPWTIAVYDVSMWLKSMQNIRTGLDAYDVKSVNLFLRRQNAKFPNLFYAGLKYVAIKTGTRRENVFAQIAQNGIQQMGLKTFFRSIGVTLKTNSMKHKISHPSASDMIDMTKGEDGLEVRLMLYFVFPTQVRNPNLDTLLMDQELTPDKSGWNFKGKDPYGLDREIPDYFDCTLSLKLLRQTEKTIALKKGEALAKVVYVPMPL